MIGLFVRFVVLVAVQLPLAVMVFGLEVGAKLFTAALWVVLLPLRLL